MKKLTIQTQDRQQILIDLYKQYLLSEIT
ncbi:transcriptional regulator, partial [Acinetobacter baumannii]